MRKKLSDVLAKWNDAGLNPKEREDFTDDLMLALIDYFNVYYAVREGDGEEARRCAEKITKENYS